jgi:hypothetical protein
LHVFNGGQCRRSARQVADRTVSLSGLFPDRIGSLRRWFRDLSGREHPWRFGPVRLVRPRAQCAIHLGYVRRHAGRRVVGRTDGGPLRSKVCLSGQPADLRNKCVCSCGSSIDGLVDRSQVRHGPGVGCRNCRWLCGPERIRATPAAGAMGGGPCDLHQRRVVCFDRGRLGHHTGAWLAMDVRPVRRGGAAGLVLAAIIAGIAALARIKGQGAGSRGGSLDDRARDCGDKNAAVAGLSADAS